MVLKGDIAKFTSMTIFPKANVHFYNDAMPRYKELLSDTGVDSFIPLTYEELFDLMKKYLKVENGNEWTEYLIRRYLLPCD